MSRSGWKETTIEFANNFLNKLVCVKWSTEGTSDCMQIGIFVEAEKYLDVVMFTLDCASGSENIVLVEAHNLINIQEYSDIARMMFKLEYDIS
jgi:Ni,Fe-hydrogenase III component G